MNDRRDSMKKESYPPSRWRRRMRKVKTGTTLGGRGRDPAKNRR